MSAPNRREALQLIGAAGLAACASQPARDIPSNPVLGVSALPPSPTPWPVPDPFLFCVHHDDAYPRGNDVLGPTTPLDLPAGRSASLRAPAEPARAGRVLGNDFAGKDGWRMYHGRQVPGFPAHPHRGFETVTVARRGFVDHADSLGAAARYGGGDVQWLTAGGGIQHAEMFPLLERARPNPVELFQIWLNLPAADKFAPAHFAMLWADQVPRHVHGGTEIVTIAGALDGKRPPSPPPSSYASKATSDLAIWTIKMAPGARWNLPRASAGANRMLYVFAGKGVAIAGRDIAAGHVVDLRADAVARIDNGAAESELLLLQGQPIGEPVVKHGPFVMNSKAEIQQAIRDYQLTQFGGWSWPSAEPVHPREAGRFARHADGRIERPA